MGNLTPLFKAVWPACWKNHEVCNEGWLHAIDYLEIVGIIVGQTLSVSRVTGSVVASVWSKMR